MLKRLPTLASSLQLYAVIALLTYGWTLVKYLWVVPSWSLFLNLNEILALLAYALASAFLESLAILVILLLAALTLPGKLFKNDFIVRGVWFVLIAYGGMMIYLTLYNTYGVFIGSYWIVWTVGSLALALVAAQYSTRLQFARSAALWFSDQVLIFLFILVPASVISLLVVIARNLN